MRIDSSICLKRKKKPIISKNYKIGFKKALGLCLNLGKKNLVVLRARRGFIMCGYLNLKVADKFADAACTVKGVSSVEDLLEAPIFDLTKKAYSLGVRKGMPAKEAVLKLS